MHGNLLEQRVHSRQLRDLLPSVLQRVTDTSTELGDFRHVCRQVIHLILHPLEIILHLNHDSIYATCQTEEKITVHGKES